MCEINLEHKNNVRVTKGEKVFYMKVQRAIYGCIESALQWYKYFTEVLQKEGYVINPYDMCVANKEVGGKQCKIAWRIDDNIVTHDDEKVLDNVIEMISEHFGELTITKGEEHKFLGMSVNIWKDKKIEISMKDQILEAFESFD